MKEWLQLRFSSHASDATKLEKIASPARAEIAGVAAAFRLFRITIFRLKALLHCEMLSSSIFVSVRTNSNRNFVVDLRIFVSVRTNSNRNLVVRFANFRFSTYELQTKFRC